MNPARVLMMVVALLALGASADSLRETIEGKLEQSDEWPLGGSKPEEYEEATVPPA